MPEPGATYPNPDPPEDDVCTRVGSSPQALVEAGADVDALNDYGQTALFLAAQHGHTPAVRHSNQTFPVFV
jgi:ankyrin repeat protein